MGGSLWLVLLISLHHPLFSSFFFFNDTATTEIYTLSLHDALPIYARVERLPRRLGDVIAKINVRLQAVDIGQLVAGDRKSTRLNSSHLVISYAVFCLKKKKRIATEIA